MGASFLGGGGSNSSATILKGTLDGLAYFQSQGGVIGGGLSDAQRQLNGTALQAAISQATSQNKFFEMGDAYIEIDFLNPYGDQQTAAGVGLFVGWQDGFTWIASEESRIVQFANGPVMTIGDLHGSNECKAHEYRGLYLSHGIDQSTNTIGDVLQIGRTWRSAFSNVMLGDNTYNFAAYRGLHLRNDSQAFFFSNTMENLQVFNCRQNHILHGTSGTQNEWINIYCNNGNQGSWNPVVCPLQLATGGQAVDGGHWDGLNIEWCLTNIIVDCEIARSVTFENIHFEGNKLTGANPCVIKVGGGSEVTFLGGDIYNTYIQSENGATGLPQIVQSNWGGRVSFKATEFRWDGTGYIDMPAVMTQHNLNGNEPMYLTLDDCAIINSYGGVPTNLSYDPILRSSTFGVPSARHYSARGGVSILDEVIFGSGGGVPGITAAPSTLYGAHGRHVTLNDDWGLGQNKFTLSQYHTPFGSLPRAAGEKIVYYHPSSGPNNNAAYSFLTDSGSVIANHTTVAGLEYAIGFVFNGSSWAYDVASVPGAVANAAVSGVTPTQAVLSWLSPVSGGQAVTHTVAQSNSASGPWTPLTSVTDTVGVLTTTATGLSQNTAYYWSITPQNVAITGLQSGNATIISATTGTATPPAVAPALVQHGSLTIASTNPISVKLANPPTLGNMLILMTSGDNGFGHTGPSGSTLQATYNDGSNHGVGIWTLPVTNAVAASNTITWATDGGASYAGFATVCEVSGYYSAQFVAAPASTSGTTATFKEVASSLYGLPLVQWAGNDPNTTPSQAMANTVTLENGAGHGGYGRGLLCELPVSYQGTVTATVGSGTNLYGCVTIFGH